MKVSEFLFSLQKCSLNKKTYNKGTSSFVLSTRASNFAPLFFGHSILMTFHNRMEWFAHKLIQNYAFRIIEFNVSHFNRSENKCLQIDFLLFYFWKFFYFQNLADKNKVFEKKMAQPIPIVADPISSDGSEESWILLDEMDEAMREEYNGASNLNETNNDETDVTSSAATMANESGSPEIGMIAENYDNIDEDDGPMIAEEEPSVDYPSNVETMSSVEAISACPSNDDDDDDINDAVHLRRLERSHVFHIL